MSCPVNGFLSLRMLRNTADARRCSYFRAWATCTDKRFVESLKRKSEEISSVQKELGGLYCRWNAYHQNLDRIDEMKH